MAIEKLTVDIGADTSGLQSGFQLVNKTLLSIQKIIADMNSTVSMMASAMQNGFSAVSTAATSAKSDILGTSSAMGTLSTNAQTAQTVLSAMEAPELGTSAKIEVDRSQYDNLTAPQNLPIHAAVENTVPPVNVPVENTVSTIQTPMKASKTVVPDQIEVPVTSMAPSVDFSPIISESQTAADAVKSVGIAAQSSGNAISAVMDASAGSVADVSGAAESACAPVSQLGSSFRDMSASASGAATGAGFAEVKTDAEEVAESVDDATDAFKKAKKPVDDVGKSVDETGKKMKSADQSCTTLASGFRKLATVVATSAFLKGSISNAMEAESSVQQLDFTLGESSAAFREWANSNANALNMSKNQIMSYGKVYSNLISSMTNDTDQMASATQQLLSASAVIASRTGRTTQDVMERIRSGLLGNTEAIEDLGIYANVSMIESTKAFKQIAGDKSWNQLSYKTQQQIRLMSILEQTQEKYGTDVLRNTASGVSNLSAVWENFKTDIGEALIPVITSVLPALSAAIVAVTPAFVWLAKAVSTVVVWFSGLSTPAKTLLALSVGLAFAIPLVTKAMVLWTTAQKGLIFMQSILIPQTITFGTVLKSAFGWLSIAIGAIGLLWAFFGNEKSNTADAIDTTATSAENASQSIGALTDSFKNLNSATEDLGDSKDTKDKLAGFDEINVLSNDNGSLVSGLVKDSDLPLIDAASDGIAGLQKQLGEIQGDYPITISTNQKTVGQTIKEWYSQTFKPFMTGVGYDFYDIFHGSAEESALAVEDLDGKCRTVFGNGWTDFWEERGAKLCAGINNGQTGATGVLTSMNAFVEFTFGQKWSDHWQEVGKNVYDAFHAQEEPVIGVFSAIEEGIRGVFGDEWVKFWEGVGVEVYNILHKSIFGELEKSLKEKGEKYSKYTTVFTDLINSNTPSKEEAPWRYDQNISELMAKDISLDYKTAIRVVSKEAQNRVNGAGPLVPAYATGGFPETGEMFIAREKGPELVGRIGNSTAVANNGQIIEGIKQAVLSAMLQANSSGSGNEITIHNYTKLDGRVIGESVSKYSHGKASRA